MQNAATIEQGMNVRSKLQVSNRVFGKLMKNDARLTAPKISAVNPME